GDAHRRRCRVVQAVVPRMWRVNLRPPQLLDRELDRLQRISGIGEIKAGQEGPDRRDAWTCGNRDFRHFAQVLFDSVAKALPQSRSLLLGELEYAFVLSLHLELYPGADDFRSPDKFVTSEKWVCAVGSFSGLWPACWPARSCRAPEDGLHSHHAPG